MKIKFKNKSELEINNMLKKLLEDGYKITKEEYQYYFEHALELKNFNIFYYLYFMSDEKKRKELESEIEFFKNIIEKKIDKIIETNKDNLKNDKIWLENKGFTKEQLKEDLNNLKKIKETIKNIDLNDIEIEKILKNMYKVNYLIIQFQIFLDEIE